MTDLPNTPGSDTQSDVNNLQQTISPSVIEPPNLNQNNGVNTTPPSQQTIPVQTQQVVPTTNFAPQPVAPVSSVGGKEKGIIPIPEAPVEEIGVMPELGPELKEAGIEQVSETIDLPQPVTDITGMTPIGPTTPVLTQNPLPVNVPLTNDQIQKAFHQKIADSILWLAYWCMRQVKMAQAKILKKETI